MSQSTNKGNLGIHLKYCITIFIVVNCIVGGLALYNQKLAIAGLSNAGLLLSIVLAVIAILITLWDVAGQRNTVSTIISVTQSLDNASKDIINNVDSFKSAVERVLEMKDKLEGTMESIKISVEELEYKIEQNDKPEIIKKELQEFKNKIKKIEINENATLPLSKKEFYKEYKDLTLISNQIIEMVNKGQIPKIFTLKDIVNKMIDRNINFSIKSLEESINTLIELDVIEKKKEGKYLIIENK